AVDGYHRQVGNAAGELAAPIGKRTGALKCKIDGRSAGKMQKAREEAALWLGHGCLHGKPVFFRGIEDIGERARIRLVLAEGLEVQRNIGAGGIDRTFESQRETAARHGGSQADVRYVDLRDTDADRQGEAGTAAACRRLGRLR